MSNIFTSESVCAGHPDKIADQISDAILDHALQQDPNSRVAVEVMVTTNTVIIAGEITSKAKLNFKSIAAAQINRLGYNYPKLNFTANAKVEVYVHNQSPEIAKGVDLSGAGDQGIMFGYATNQTKNFMPLPIELAHRLAQAIDKTRQTNTIPFLLPDGKTQATLSYNRHRPSAVELIILAVPHTKEISPSDLKSKLVETVVAPLLDHYQLKLPPKADIVLNGTGVWHHGGPDSDTGLTGRKIIVDTYGGWARSGGGCFSGKDPTKVDRSGAYAARYLAKNIVAHSLADEIEVRLAYFIGAKKPVMQELETFGTHKKPLRVIKDFASKLIDTSVGGIIETLDLRRPIYLPTAAYGHFGRPRFSWEQICQTI